MFTSVVADDHVAVSIVSFMHISKEQVDGIVVAS